MIDHCVLNTPLNFSYEIFEERMGGPASWRIRQEKMWETGESFGGERQARLREAVSAGVLGPGQRGVGRVVRRCGSELWHEIPSFLASSSKDFRNNRGYFSRLWGYDNGSF